MNHNSPFEIREVLLKQGVRPQKRWGQNFMINPRSREKMISLLKIQSDHVVWEIGPGAGALTELLLNVCNRLILFEIDHGLIRHLTDLFDGEEGLNIIAGDFVRTWRKSYSNLGKPNRIIGNLPYNSASAIIGSLIENNAIAEKCIFTVQKELADRIIAVPGSRNYSSFSVLCQSLTEVTDHGELAPRTFYPAPEVKSSVVELSSNKKIDQIMNLPLFLEFIRTAFMARRKTLRNNLLSGSDFGLAKSKILDVVADIGVDAGLRAEELDISMLIELSNALFSEGAFCSKK